MRGSENIFVAAASHYAYTFVGSVQVEKLSLTSVLWLTRVARIKKKQIQTEQIEIEPIFTKSRLR